MEKLTKQDIRGPDTFISTMDRISQWSYDYRKHLAALLAVVTIAALVWAGMGTYTAKQEDAAGETLFAAEKTLRTIDEKFEPPQKMNAKGVPQKEEAPAAIPTGNIDTDYKEAIDQLKDVVARFPNTQSGVIAAIDLADVYHRYNKTELSVPILENAAKVANHPATKGLVLISLGVAYEAKGDCPNAIASWQKINGDSNLAVFNANALVKEALCYEKMNQKDKAVEIYARFDAAETQRRQLLESMAKKYALDLRFPLQYQDKAKVQQFEKEASKSEEVRRLEFLLSDRDSVKAAKKYLQLLRQGST